MAEHPHIMIVEARFYEDIADELARGAMQALDQAGASYERISVPGVFEIPAAIQMAIRSLDFSTLRRRFDGYVALGCVIRGETSHYDVICNEATRAMQEVALQYTLAFGFGVLTVDTKEQAWVRAAVDQRNKGGMAARTCLSMIEVKRQLLLFPR